jgi:hypothetical protein
MSQLLQWRIKIQHPKTKEVLSFLGDGKGVADAIADGLKTLTAPYRPKSDGLVRDAQNVAVTTAAGERVLRSLKEFEQGQP